MAELRAHPHLSPVRPSCQPIDLTITLSLCLEALRLSPTDFSQTKLCSNSTRELEFHVRGLLDKAATQGHLNAVVSVTRSIAYLYSFLLTPSCSLMDLKRTRLFVMRVLVSSATICCTSSYAVARKVGSSRREFHGVVIELDGRDLPIVSATAHFHGLIDSTSGCFLEQRCLVLRIQQLLEQAEWQAQMPQTGVVFCALLRKNGRLQLWFRT